MGAPRARPNSMAFVSPRSGDRPRSLQIEVVLLAQRLKQDSLFLVNRFPGFRSANRVLGDDLTLFGADLSHIALDVDAAVENGAGAKTDVNLAGLKSIDLSGGSSQRVGDRPQAGGDRLAILDCVRINVAGRHVFDLAGVRVVPGSRLRIIVHVLGTAFQ